MVALSDDNIQQTNANQLVDTKRRPPLQQLQVSSVHMVISFAQQTTAVFIQMFSSCTIEIVAIFDYKP